MALYRCSGEGSGGRVSELGLPIIITGVRMVFQGEGNSTHGYFHIYLDAQWTRNCTVAGAAESGDAPLDGREINLPAVNGYHEEGSVSQFHVWGDRAYVPTTDNREYWHSKYCDFTNATITYS